MATVDGDTIYKILVDRCRSLEASQAKLRKEFDGIAKGNNNTSTNSNYYYNNNIKKKVIVDDEDDDLDYSGAEGGCIPGFFAAGTPFRSILEYLGHALHVCSASSGEIVYWNRSAELLFGWKSHEALGQNGFELLVAEELYGPLNKIMERIRSGKEWAGQFPLRKRSGQMFMALVTKSPLYEGGELAGIITVSSDAAVFNNINSEQMRKIQNRNRANATFSNNSNKIQWHPPRPQITHVPQIASSVSNLASKFLSRKHEDDNCGDRDDNSTKCVENTKFEKPGKLAARVFAKLNIMGNGNSSEKEDHEGFQENGGFCTSPEIPNDYYYPFIPGLKFSSSKNKDRSAYSFKDSHNQCSGLPRPGKLISRFDFPMADADNLMDLQKVPRAEVLEIEEKGVGDKDQSEGKTFSSIGESGSQESSSSKEETSSSTGDCEIQWDHLKLGEEVGQGSFAVVYRGLWKGTDVAVKLYLQKAYTEGTLEDFKKEITIMKKLRHPNVLLFMGAVYSQDRLAIVTEFLPRGSLFKTLHKNNQALDFRKRIKMAIDVARGMNYLHNRKPPIVHRDLKSSNLLVDKNWNVKVGDFGLSRWKNITFLSAKSGRGTPQWMAPEVLRNEPSNEKSDIFSFGVILWELMTVSVPWNNLNSLQVVGVVGFMDRRLDIPEKVDPQISDIIRDCWKSDPAERPSFEEIIQRMGDLVNSRTAAILRSPTV
ncbi:uncharacterized protein [Rutidosis leptorrhynchoides]|uniref:uncharacterized protein n=1 Tax=Rutidosis leptorrhynchoides TaxID=125765 RepID=UPI003A997162